MASDRVVESEDGGIVAFVTNGGFIDGAAAAGVRKYLMREFHDVYCLNMRGNARGAGDIRKREGGSVFGGNTQAGVAILILVKKPGAVNGGGELHYHDVGDYLTHEQKLAYLKENRKSSIAWRRITPDEHGDWIGQRDAGFDALIPLYGEDGAIFQLDSLGAGTRRDAWICNFSRDALADNTERMMDFFNANIPTDNPNWSGTDFKRTPWTDRMAKNGVRMEHDATKIVTGVYRAFCKQHVYFDKNVIHRIGRQLRIYPAQGHTNLGIALSEKDKNNPLSCLMTDAVPSDAMLGITTKYLPFFTYTANAKGGYDAMENINPAALAIFRERLGADDINNAGLLCYVYGVLHHPEYRSRYAANLRKEAARVPMPASLADFHAFLKAGQELALLHMNYESAEPHPLEEEWRGSPRMEDRFRVGTRKMRHPRVGGKPDETSLIYNDHLTLRGIPPAAHRYMVGQYSALRWLMERYHIKTDKDSGIVNDPNDWADEIGDPQYILNLVKRIVTVSVETMRIVDSLPPLSGAG